MGANRYMVDSGGTMRHIKKRFVVDASGITRQIKKRYIIDSGGTARLTFLYGNYFSIVAGSDSSFSGYQAVSAPLYGSISPSSMLNDGKVINTLISGGSAPAPLILTIGGFASNPGSSYVTSLTIDGVTLLGSSATFTYPYTAQGTTVALWQWAGAVTPFVSGDSYAGTLITSG